MEGVKRASTIDIDRSNSGSVIFDFVRGQRFDPCEVLIESRESIGGGLKRRRRDE